MSFLSHYLSSSPLVFLGFLSAYVLLRIVYRSINNPLSAIPGPQASKWTSLIITYHWFMGQRPEYVHSLHEKYGPIVRVSPNEVHINDIAAAREIHKVGGRFLKSSWYNTLVPVGTENMFSTNNMAFHSRHRRLLSAPISETSLKRFEPIILDITSLAIRRISEELASRGTADVFKWWSFLATDVIGELSFGESFRMLERGGKNRYSRDLEYVSSLHPLRTTFPFFIRLSKYVPIPMFRKALSVGGRLATYATQSLERYKTLLTLNPTDPKPTLFTKVFSAGKDGLSDREIMYEAQGYIVAGSDTTAVTITYLVYSVCRNVKIRDKLVAELQSLPEGFSDKDVRDLPYLNGVINETLRLCSAIPSALPRVVPPEGAHFAGYQLPPGITISTQAYSMHRDSTIFPNPDRFDPSRWSSPTKEMKDAFMPFGGGSRICIGMHLARLETRVAAAHFFRRFPNARVSTKEGMRDSDMKQSMFFLMAPKGHRCLIEA